MGTPVGKFTTFYKFSSIHVREDPSDVAKSWWKIDNQIILTTPIGEKIICDVTKEVDGEFQEMTQEIEELIRNFHKWNYQETEMTSPYANAAELKAAIKYSLANPVATDW